MKKILFVLVLLVIIKSVSAQQVMQLQAIIDTIYMVNPGLKMFDAQIRSLDEAAKGARNWEAPELSTGLWMTPYNPNLWKKQSNGSAGMGQYMISAQQYAGNVISGERKKECKPE